MRFLILFFATGAGSGYSPIAPGTAGSAVSLVLIWAFIGQWMNASPAPFAVIFAAAFVLSCVIAGRAEVIFGEKDASRIVLDEVLGMIATMYLNPLSPAFLIA